MFNVFTPTGSYPPQVSVGGYYEGGIVGYIFQPGDPGYVAGEQHGLIISQLTPPLVTEGGSTCWPSGYPWTTRNILPMINMPGLSVDIGTGQSNTTTIVTVNSYGVSVCTYDPAKLCDTYTSNGYSDWYLPSLNELTSIGANRASLPDWGNGYQYLWCSTQFDQDNAYIVDTVDNSTTITLKWGNSIGPPFGLFGRYRPVRTF